MRRYVFTSRQSSPAGTHRTRLAFLVTTEASGDETADILTYENAAGDAPFAPGVLNDSCAHASAVRDGVLMEFLLTPPARDLSSVIPACAPEDLRGAVSDILPLFMVQSQPRFRARELQQVGERLRFGGYVVRWQIPPDVPDQRIVADSGIVTLDSVGTGVIEITWNTSPMSVSVVRRLANAPNMLLQGTEWFVARVRVDRASGLLLAASTDADSLRLHARFGYPADTVSTMAGDTSGPLVRVVRSLDLRLDDPRR